MPIYLFMWCLTAFFSQNFIAHVIVAQNKNFFYILIQRKYTKETIICSRNGDRAPITRSWRELHTHFPLILNFLVENLSIPQATMNLL